MMTDREEVKKLIIAQLVMDNNWKHKQPLDSGLDTYKKTNPKELAHLKDIYKRIDEALNK